MEEKRVKIAEAKGRPMLHWVGKKPLDFIKSFPAQLVEVFDPTRKARQIENPTFEDLKENWQNLLFHGDNKEVLGFLLANGFRGKIDLVYIDPPFDSGANYIRKVELRGTKKKVEIEGEDYSAVEQIQYFDIWSNDAYFQFMYERLTLLKELLSDEGVIFLHCDPKRGHYLKLIMDEIFGPDYFRNEIVWHYMTYQGQVKRYFPWKHDTILFYTKTDNYPFKLLKKQNFEDNIDYKRWHRYIVNENEIRGDNYPETDSRFDVFIDKWKEENGGRKPTKDDVIYRLEGFTVDSVWDIKVEDPKSLNRTGYPTQKPEELLQRIIESASEKKALVLDCFMGSGTTQVVAQHMNRRWIGVDINKGSIQTTIKRLQKVIQEQSKNGKQKILNGDTEKPCLSFAHYKVNDYDLQLLRTEAIELAVQHIGIQRTKTDTFFDGALGKNLVKIIDFNHPLTLLDLQLIQDELKKRPDENRNITMVCLGKELAVDPFIEDYNKKHPVNKLEVIELRTDKKYGKFLIHKPAQAKVSIKRKGEKAQIEIKDFISPSIIERLNDEEKLIEIKIPDFRSMIDIVLIDTDYNRKVFNITYSDVPEKKKDLVEGKYELDIPKKKTTIAVKIIDMLGEEVLINEEI